MRARLECTVRSGTGGSVGAASIVGGWSLIAATVLFGAVFTYLAGTFGYPDILDRPAAEVLPRLLSLGATGRAVWILYGLVPFLLVPTAIGVGAAARDAAPQAARAALIAAVLSAASMAVGLLRWPSLHWHLALAYAGAGESARESLEFVFGAANSYLGNFIGEFLGELFLNSFFLCASIALARAGGPRWRWLVYAGSAAAVLGGVAMLRNMTPMVAPMAAVNNVALPIWMLILGGALVTLGRRLARPRSAEVS